MKFMNFLLSGTFWTALGSLAAIVTLIISILQLRKRKLKKRQSKSEKGQSKSEKGQSKSEKGQSTLNPLEIIRKKNEVRELRPLEVGKELQNLPNGIFGFTVPWGLEEINGISLSQKMGGTAKAEVHKTVAGEIKIIGYVNESTLIRLEDPSRTIPIETEVFVKSYAEYSHPIAISKENILQCKHRGIEKAELWDMKIK